METRRKGSKKSENKNVESLFAWTISHAIEDDATVAVRRVSACATKDESRCNVQHDPVPSTTPPLMTMEPGNPGQYFLHCLSLASFIIFMHETQCRPALHAHLCNLHTSSAALITIPGLIISDAVASSLDLSTAHSHSRSFCYCLCPSLPPTLFS